MAGILKTKVSTYEFDLDAIRDLIAADLEVDPRKVEVKYVIQNMGADCLDRNPGYPAVTKIQVTVSH